ncbi:MAG: helix-turn-helix transcriptional regulator [Archangiaceae bacterium]|nr:helix-turn-helix transcriptional regulator [Archangiaceae bacterium]
MSDAGKSRALFLALLALAEGPKHGYEISSWVSAKSAGFFTLSFGALYPILHKLEQDGLARGSWDNSGGARARKVYALTAKGKKALADERSSYRELALAFDRLLGESKG